MLVGVPTPCQGAEPDPGHTQAGTTEMPLLHERRDYWPELTKWVACGQRFPRPRRPYPSCPWGLPPPDPRFGPEGASSSNAGRAGWCRPGEIHAPPPPEADALVSVAQGTLLIGKGNRP
ncbi:hypothetical protein GCM10023084_12450 [Streptomyces lacrimifluminis]|uniref:Uncharacterized protein n=1 Tax=Streptomyces lacrimifluminis TaxID=1500077 RepID=A0A917NQA7_9ACTN|nr:hypothetical protein GCM10012282_14260 [Streptomyces lacrimifluminis]